MSSTFKKCVLLLEFTKKMLLVNMPLILSSFPLFPVLNKMTMTDYICISEICSEMLECWILTSDLSHPVSCSLVVRVSINEIKF